jgi:UPF0755 protein
MFKKIKRLIIIIILFLLLFWGYKYYQSRQEVKAIKWTPRAEKSITVIEGWNLKNINTYLAEQGFKFADELSDLKVKDYSAQYSFLADAPKNVSLEGYVFPDTYRVYASSTLDEVLTKMLDNFDSKLTNQMRQDVVSQKKTVYEILTMASILEKEVKSEEDMKIVSGIFWDRIKNGQALESCATLAYILGANKAQYTVADTKIDSPYNTYQNRGLPPGPISNPSLKAIRSAIYPVYTDYNYFLSRPDTGETVFSATYEEHVKNKAKYLN